MQIRGVEVGEGRTIKCRAEMGPVGVAQRN